MSSVAARLFILARLACGGAIAGFFIGSMAAGLVGLALTTWSENLSVGVENVFLCGLGVSVIGGLWGLVLAITEQSHDSEPRSSRELSAIDAKTRNAG